MDESLLGNFLLAIVAILNPVGKVPVWLEACEGCDAPVRLRLAAMVTATATGLLLLFLLFGRAILEFLGLDLAAFRVGGGVVILLIGLDMLRGEAVDIGTEPEERDRDVFDRAKARFREVVVPLSVPILAGPGSITTAILYGSRADDWASRGTLAAALVATMVLVLGVLLAGNRIRAALGDVVLTVQTRIWGLLLAAIAAQLILEGLGETFPSWLGPESPVADDVRSARPQ